MLPDLEKQERSPLDELSSCISDAGPTWREIGLLVLTAFGVTASIVFTSPLVERGFQLHGKYAMTRIIETDPGLFWPNLFFYSYLLFGTKLPLGFRVPVSLISGLLAFWSTLNAFKVYSNHGDVSTFDFVSNFFFTSNTLALYTSLLFHAIMSRSNSGVKDGKDEGEYVCCCFED